MPSSRVISDQDLRRRLRDAGVPLRDDLPPDPGGLKVTQEGGYAESLMLSLSWGRTGYLLWVQAVSARTNLVICGWKLVLPWEDENFQWLPDPLGQTPRDEYVFPGKHGLELPRDQALNHLAGRVLRRGSVLKGALLGVGRKPIPPEYPHGAFVKAQLSAIDQFDQNFSTDVSFFVDRSMESSIMVSKKQAGKGLFEREEVLQGTTMQAEIGRGSGEPTCLGPSRTQGALARGTNPPQGRRDAQKPGGG